MSEIANQEVKVENLPELSSLSDQDLKSLIRDLVTKEQEHSYERRLLHGKIDILRAELVERLSGKRSSGESLITDADVAKLTEILSHKDPFPPTKDVADNGE
ncbi:MAG: RsiG family protein [Thermoleophilia bacterium]